MKLSIPCLLKKEKPRIVLILQGNTAHWFKVVGKKVVDCFDEYLPGYSTPHGSLCPWPGMSEGSGPVSVELVLDTTLDEIDRVSVEQSDIAFVNRYRRFMTMARLRRDYSQAKVYAVSAGKDATVAALMHPSIPESWASWLLSLQSSNLVFHRVATGCELTAFWSRHREENLMIVMQVADYERHMLVQRGAVVFLRTVPLRESKDVAEDPRQTSIAQSMEYLDTVVGTEVHATLVIDSEYQMATLLAMLLEQHVEHEFSLLDKSADASDVSESKRTQKHRRYLPVNALVLKIWKRFSECLPAGCRKSIAHWSLRHSVLRELDSLAPSVRYAKTSYRVACAYQLSVVLVIMAAIAASSALYHGVASRRLVIQDEARLRSIGNDMTEIYSTSAALFLHPEAGADSLFIADKLAGSESEHLAAEYLLEVVATVVTAVPELQLDRLIWAPVVGNELYDSLSYSLDSVSHRQGIETDERGFNFQLEMSGQVSGETLKAQQSVLKGFVSELSNSPGTRDITVLESPVDTALSSESDAKRLGRYRVALLLGKT
ncbi:MAG: hypothetical protein AB8B87_13865 [Granulosicoccus sp.]